MIFVASRQPLDIQSLQTEFVKTLKADMVVDKCLLCFTSVQVNIHALFSISIKKGKFFFPRSLYIDFRVSENNEVSFEGMHGLTLVGISIYIRACFTIVGNGDCVT